MDIRKQQESEAGGIVEKGTEKARRHPFWTKLIIVILVLTALVTLANQGIELLKNLGFVPKRS